MIPVPKAAQSGEATTVYPALEVVPSGELGARRNCLQEQPHHEVRQHCDVALGDPCLSLLRDVAPF
ncbi:MAG TPA: hypothetical protein DCK93_13625 [Blastocatellia bacterium]|nr:hypothetical protein [Blastocatellia bacterium]